MHLYPRFSDCNELNRDDLLQDVIVRLIERDCAAMKRFTGSSENEFLAYLAVISRSVVRSAVRRASAKKRKVAPEPKGNEESDVSLKAYSARKVYPLERMILAREIRDLSEKVIQENSRECSVRDRLIFRLFFYEELTTEQIAHCKGIDLSRRGVEKVLQRVTGRLRHASEQGTDKAVPL